MTLLEFVYVSLATYYLTAAFSDVVHAIINWHMEKGVDYVKKSWRWAKWLGRKPLNCVLCMSFYIAVALVILSLLLPAIIIVPAVAGVALLLSKIQQKLETFTID